MPVKYECPKCEKRFVEWGAAKLNFKCPSCEDEQLVQVGSVDDRPVKKPTLRKRVKATKAREEVTAPVDTGDEEEYVEEPEEEEVTIGLTIKDPVKGTDDFDDDTVVDDDDAELSDDDEGSQEEEFGEEEGMGHIDLDEKL